MTITMEWMRRSLVALWWWLREVSEDAAYERYQRHLGDTVAGARMSPRQFYLDRLASKYSRPCRCC